MPPTVTEALTTFFVASLNHASAPPWRSIARSSATQDIASPGSGSRSIMWAPARTGIAENVPAGVTMSSAVPLIKDRRTGTVIVTFRPKSQNSFGPSICHRVHAWIVALLVAFQDSFSLSGNAQTSRAGLYVVSMVAVYDALKVPRSVQIHPVKRNTRTSWMIARSAARYHV